MHKNTQKTQEVIDLIKLDLAESKLSQRKIANKHGVSPDYVRKVKNNQATPLINKKQEQADPTNQEILSLEARVIALQDERNRLNKAYKAAQRRNSIYEAVVDELKQVVTPIKPFLKIQKPQYAKKQIEESAILFLSDEHADSIVLPHQVGGLERYDFRIALRRAEELVDTTIKFTQHTLSNYNFKNLYIFALGDHVSGEIHGAVEHSYYRNMFRNTLATGQMHALMLRDLSQWFENINIVYLSGNHGRRSVKKDYEEPWNNWDYLVAETAKAYMCEVENVHFIIPESYSANVDIEGHGFNLFHGDDIRSWSGIPWYGIERKTRRLAALNSVQNKQIQYYCMGHFHNPATQAQLNGETIINGAWVGTSPFAFNALSVYNPPSQWLMGVHRERGISWRLNVLLKTEREHLGSNRYNVILANQL